MWLRMCFMCLLALGWAGNARADDVFSSLHRGVNAAAWLANAVRQPLFDRDFAQIRQVGFDHVRLPVSPEEMGFRLAEDSPGMAAADFRPVDKAIAMANNNRLVVILDIHPHGPFVQSVQDNAWAEQQFIDMWVALAQCIIISRRTCWRSSC